MSTKRTFIIAEAGVNHNGRLSLAKKHYGTEAMVAISEFSY